MARHRTCSKEAASPGPVPAKHTAYLEAKASCMPSGKDDIIRGARFAALPPEIRNYIFALLIVRPVKWDVLHSNSCQCRHVNTILTPALHPPYTCVACRDYENSSFIWRHNRRPIWSSPWRSKWAEEQRNPYVCTDCYDHKFRQRPFPKAVSLPCLCARRENLEVFLVCRQWYEQAAKVFYTENIFAFEDSSTFVNFITGINPEWRRMITRISLMARINELQDISLHGNTPVRDMGLEGKTLERMWSCLRMLPNLTYLELDSLFLVRTTTVRPMLKLGLRGLRYLWFVERKSPDDINLVQGSVEVWPAIARRIPLQGGFAADVGRAIKGERLRWIKNVGALEVAVLRHQIDVGLVS